MNHMTSIARSAGQQCARFTALFLLTLRELVSTLQINSYAQPMDNFAHKLLTRLRHAHVIHMLDSRGTLSARALKGLRASLKCVACSVAIAIGISLCLPMAHASSGSIDAINPKTYIRLSMDHKEALCLITLYGKESAFNPYAIGNLDGKYHTYGIPQIKNPIIYDKSPIEQVRYGIKYIDHRYSGSTCKALHHWEVWGWH